MALGIGKLIALTALMAVTAAQLCPCPKHYFPMCGSDGVTYGNECTFRCARSNNPSLSLEHKGNCRSKRATDKPCFCTNKFKPICGSNNLTYKNQCLLKCASKIDPEIKMAYLGACDVEKTPTIYACACPKNYSPQCGTDGVTYGNKCTLNCAKNTKPDLSLSHSGKCLKAGDQKSIPLEEICPCTRELLLTCGTNGRTYGNPCMLKCAAKKDPTLMAAYSGPCLEN